MSLATLRCCRLSTDIVQVPPANSASVRSETVNKGNSSQVFLYRIENFEKTSRNTSATTDSTRDDSDRRFSGPSAARSRLPSNTGHD